MAITQKIYSSRSNSIDSTLYVGEAGRLFYAQTTATGLAPTLRYSDGETPGGLPLTGASISVSGLPPEHPVEGNLWYDDADGRLYIYYDNTWVDASPNSITTSTFSVGNLSVGGTINLPVLTAAPINPLAGTMAVCDGASWDPASTGVQNLVIYLNSNWVKLG